MYSSCQLLSSLHQTIINYYKTLKNKINNIREQGIRIKILYQGHTFTYNNLFYTDPRLLSYVANKLKFDYIGLRVRFVK